MIIFSYLSGLLIRTASAAAVNVVIPGANPNTPPGIVANLYDFALAIGGLLAFAMIVYGGVKYIAAAGNHSKLEDAKEQITDALLGLLLLLGAWLVLYIVNPDLVKLHIYQISNISSGSVAAANGSTSQPFLLLSNPSSSMFLPASGSSTSSSGSSTPTTPTAPPYSGGSVNAPPAIILPSSH